MPKGPRGEQRPADLIGCAVTVARIATGEAEDEMRKPALGMRIGAAGGKARAEKLTGGQRHQIAKTAAAGRWR